MSKITITVEGDHGEITSAIRAFECSTEALKDQGFEIGAYMVGTDESTLTFRGRSVRGDQS